MFKPTKQLSKIEFVALIAMMFATIAFSLDAMLPALPDIGRELSPQSPNNAQLIVTSFILGIGIGTFFTGPLSDTFGRKSVILLGATIYISASTLAYFSTSLELILLARTLQGLGAAAPRIASLAIIRDLYSGREMARIISLGMMIFTIVPAMAPLMGTGIIAISGWRSIFLIFILFSITTTTWLWIRQPETLEKTNRRPLRLRPLRQALAELLKHPIVRIAILVQTICLAILFSMLATVQPIYEITFNKGDSFPYWFGLVALLSATGSLLNAALVTTLGMRRIITWSLILQIMFSGMMIYVSSATLSLDVQFAFFVSWQIYVFTMAGTTMGNLNSIAMEPMGHIAGITASAVTGFATMGAALIASPIGLLFDQSTLPLSVSLFCLSIVGVSFMTLMSKIDVQITRAI